MSRGARAVFIYRGQLDIERSRITFLLDCAAEAFESVDVVHLTPGLGAGEDAWRPLIEGKPSVRSLRTIDSRLTRLRAAKSELRRTIPRTASVIAVGFSAGAFLPPGRCDVWCINGIPEERLLSHSGWRARAAVAAAWWFGRRVHARKHVVVSEPMSRLVNSRLNAKSVTVVPNTVDTGVFGVHHMSAPTHLTYQGGGSPWQGLDRLSLVWQAIHRLDSSLRFRVISRDPRARVLLEGLPDEVAELVASSDPGQVAQWLAEARLGFLYRAPNLVNQVAWPMKFGEYLSAGAPVVVSRCGWDIEKQVEQSGAGIVVDWHASPETVAEAVVSYLESIGTARPPGVADAASYLDASRWKEGVVREFAGAADGI